jgi:NAD(P)-dependent dehydrogenase (short-subunit alcohol dehydrogenase family)
MTKITLITGANKGLGREAARRLIEAGHTVYLGARDAERGAVAAAAIGATFVQIDVTDDDSVAAAMKTIGDAAGRLDVLINNAGIAGGRAAPADVTADDLRRVYETNVFGLVRVTHAALPLLQRSTAPVIVNVSSGLGSLTWNADPNWEYAPVKLLGYNASKAAMNMFTVHLAYELRGTGIKVNSSDPGYTATALNGFRGHQTVEEGAAETVRLAFLPPEGPTGGFFATAVSDPW